MYNYDPKYALLMFFGIVIILYLLFRPIKGWFWIIKNNYKVDEKTVIEDILKYLFHNENSNNTVCTIDLLKALKFKDSVLIKVIDKMLINELIYFEKESLKLTDNGRNYAIKIVRLHRLWESYLAEKTGFGRDEWHNIAEKKEHELSEEVADKLAESLGHPIFDPHGDPIPTFSGKIAKINGSALSSLPVNTIGQIIHIEDKPEIVFKQILAENIHIGSHIRIIKSNPTRIVFYSEGEEFKIAPIIAGNITILVDDDSENKIENVARLSSLKKGEKAKVVGLSKESRGDSRRRLLDLGFVRGADVEIDLINPLGEPTAYYIKGATIALRKSQAVKILIEKF
jgi:DtxR family Mn-dependent transcriptional regulator